MNVWFPLKRVESAASFFARPVSRPTGSEISAIEGSARIYIVPLGSRIDQRILRASLERKGFAPPRWVATSRRGTLESEVREAFLEGEPALVPLTPPRNGPDRLARLLEWASRAGKPVELVPVETLWGPAGRIPSMLNLLIGNPYDPPEWSRWLRFREKGRVRVVVGVPGTLAKLAKEAPQPGNFLALSAYVRGQALKALSHREREILGERYKVPRLMVEQIIGENSFKEETAAAGASIGLTRTESLKRAETGLRELVTSHNLLYMELFRRFVTWLYTKIYDKDIDVHPHEIEKLRALGRTSALVFIPSHKSNFDHMMLYHLLFTNGFAPPHTAAGNNMSFFPMSRILPKTGAYFIRRSFQNDPIYKESLRGFINYLVQRRFHQEFFIEGGRTRSGKLLPPRYGMLRYIVDGIRRADVSDVYFVPTAITYDQVFEVEEYVKEQLGGKKERESFGFLMRMIRSLGERQLGKVHIRFADPITLRGYMERSGDDRLVVEKLAFQISNGINRVTLLTPVELVSSILASAGRRALTTEELCAETQRMIDYAVEHKISVSEELTQGPDVTVEAALTALRRSGVVDVYTDGIDPVYFVSDSHKHAAAYYRNTVIHFFLVRAITSLAQRAASMSEDAEHWALRLRDLLKFEFFFAEKETFLAEVEHESQILSHEQELGLPPIRAAGPGIVLDYLESYWVVTQVLRQLGTEGRTIQEAQLLQRCHSLGQQFLHQDRVHAPEHLSSINFRNALRLAINLEAAIQTPEGYLPGNPEALQALALDLEHLGVMARR